MVGQTEIIMAPLCIVQCWSQEKQKVKLRFVHLMFLDGSEELIDVVHAYCRLT